jgi:hypothetical protein
MKHSTVFPGIMILFLFAGCGGIGGMVGEGTAPTPTQAVSAKAVATCTDLNKIFQYSSTTLASASVVPAGMR